MKYQRHKASLVAVLLLIAASILFSLKVGNRQSGKNTRDGGDENVLSPVGDHLVNPSPTTKSPRDPNNRESVRKLQNDLFIDLQARLSSKSGDIQSMLVEAEAKLSPTLFKNFLDLVILNEGYRSFDADFVNLVERKVPDGERELVYAKVTGRLAADPSELDVFAALIPDAQVRTKAYQRLVLEYAKQSSGYEKAIGVITRSASDYEKRMMIAGAAQALEQFPPDEVSALEPWKRLLKSPLLPSDLRDTLEKAVSNCETSNFGP